MSSRSDLPAHRRAAIAGLGMTEMGKVYGRSAQQFAAEAVRRAVDDAGLRLNDVDGLLVSAGLNGGVDLSLQDDLGLEDLRLLSQMQSFGSTAGAMVQHAAMAVENGMADTVVCVFADAPLREGTSSGAAYAADRYSPKGWGGLIASSGFTGPNSFYALAARRHMQTYGTTSKQLGQIAVAQRDWAALNPLARFREPMDIADHQESRLVAEPFRLFDCCMVSNGGIAVIVTRGDRAAALAQPPVSVLGWAQAHPGRSMRRDDDLGLVSGAAQAGPEALRMAGVSLGDIDLAQLYDCYTFTVLLTLEDYGFCAKGEGGEFVATPGVLGPGGSLPVNTGGGQLSSYYMWGMTPLSEAIIQARGHAGDRQVPDHELLLVSGNGGIFSHHSTLVLSA
ncbi:thiolase family protein [Saccharopolyspora dendranthemae]|uniref:Acetyl-CoA acetyltransferase n=1 Tax=Saccharopolyspora dendranthemae TaxID=1181886 RepID=A0A561U9M7_9PSEU|nr:thiolase family protein [Saccharopolyspora dendranthemae]TWF96070.1 acetyl-CoA acetyltransferase [Saccharopolyspora dendranthemae]